jgi:Rrf2 family protein
MRAITESQGIPRKYLHAILTTLRHEGLVHSLRGSRGGYALARPPAEITALEVVQALEGRIVLVDCSESGTPCSHSPVCSTQALWAHVSRSIARELDAVTLAELAQRRRPATLPRARRGRAGRQHEPHLS